MPDPKPLLEMDSVIEPHLRIAIVRPFFTANKGGAERYALDLAGALVACGHKVDLFANEWDRPERADFRYHRVRMARKPGWLRVLTFHWNLRRALDYACYDLVLGMTPFAPQRVFWLGDGLYRVWTRVAWPNALARWLMCAKRAVMLINLWLERRIMKGGAENFIVNSQLVKKQVMRDYGVPAERISLVYPGVDLARFHPGVRGQWRKSVREKLGVREDETLFLFVANNFKRKGLDLILHALAEIEPARAHLIVVGSGRRWLFARLASGLGVRAQVTFVGRAGHVEQFYGAADAFILPTRYDPFATVCLEALACGLPVITSNMNGAAELIRAEENGLVVNLSTRGSLAHAMRFFLDPGRRFAAGEGAAQTAKSFSFQDHILRMTATLAAMGAKRDLRFNLVQPERNLVINRAFLPLLESRGLTSLAAFLEARGAEQVAYNRSKQIHLYHLQAQDKPVTLYLKRHCSRPSRMDLWHKLVRRKLVSEGMREWRNILEFKSCALPTVVPLAAGERLLPSGFRESFVMTEGLDKHVALDQYIKEHLAPPLDARRRGEKRGLIAAVACLTRHLHWLGFNHRDYYLCHLFVRPGDGGAEDLRIIDLQRVGYHMPLSAHWIVKDLAALHYSSLGLPLTNRDRLRFYALYSRGRRGRKRQIKWVLRKSAAIARHDLRLRQSDGQEKAPPSNGGGSLGNPTTQNLKTSERIPAQLSS